MARTLGGRGEYRLSCVLRVRTREETSASIELLCPGADRRKE